MTQKEWLKLKELFKQMSDELKVANLTDEEKKEYEVTLAKLAGAISSPWLPMGDLQRFIVVLIILLVVVRANSENHLVYLLLVLPLFSPRIVGEIAVFVGRIKSIFK